MTLSLHHQKFPSVWSYEPMWSVQVTAYYIWLPATLLREKFVPEHMKALFGNLVGFAWAIVFASILAD